VPLNPKGNHPVFPLLPDGKRDVDHSWKLADTWKQMEDVLKKGELPILFQFLGSPTSYLLIFNFIGKVRSIGVSNFSEVKLEEILSTAKVIPAVNQVGIVYVRTELS
jgi:glycerol 2-dehydrogenase (NADP+)